MTLAISSLSKEYIKAPVTADVDPTDSAVAFAFTDIGAEPADDDWTAGEWVDGETSPYIARILVGPGGDIELDDGRYWCWLRITDSPEIPVERFDTVEVT